MIYPSLPTDSLYKFGFVGGIFLILAAFYIYSDKSERYIELSHQIDVEDAIIMVRSNALTEKLDLVNELLNHEKNIEMVSYADSLLKEIANEKHLLRKEEAISDAMRDKFIETSKSFRLVINSCWALMIIGLAVSTVSGCLWYNRLQVYQDKILARQFNQLDN